EGAERAELRAVRREARAAAGSGRSKARAATGSGRSEARAARRRAARRDAGRLRTCRPAVRRIRNQAHEAAVRLLGHSGRHHGGTGARRGEVAEIAYVPPPLMTADELLRTRVPDKRTELVRGVLVVREPAGSRHGLVTMNLGAELAVYAKQTGAGCVYAAESGFKLASDPDTVRAPDIAFVARERLPPASTTG